MCKRHDRLNTRLCPSGYGRAKGHSINQRKDTIRSGSTNQQHADRTASEVVCLVAICKVSTDNIKYKINQCAFKMWRIEDRGGEHEVWADLGMMELQVKGLE